MEQTRGTFPAGRILGIPLRIHWSLPLLLVLFLLIDQYGISGGIESRLPQLAIRLVFVLVIAGSVLLHELGHALASRRLGCPPACIILWPLGGLAVSTGAPGNPRGDAFVYAMGPAVSLVLCLVGLVVYFAWTAMVTVSGFGVALLVLVLFYYLGFCNLVLLLFNLIPAYPLDGGGILRAILWGHTGNLRVATLQCIKVARVIIIGVGIVGILLKELMVVVIMVWLWFTGEQQRQAIEQGAMLEEEVRPYGYDFSQGYRSLERGPSGGKRVGWWRRRQARRELERRVKERERREELRRRVDELLEKVGREGRESLTRSELRFLERASQEYGEGS